MDGYQEDPTPAQSEALLAALTTEHFTVQTAATTTVTESVGRASIFLAALSSSLIAVGFAADQPGLLKLLLAVLAPTLFVLGLFTVVRLVDNSVENLVHLSQIARIRGYYATLSPEAPQFFPRAHGTGESSTALTDRGLQPGPLLGLFTAATMIAVVDAVIGGTTLALLIALPAAAGTGRDIASVVTGLVFVGVYVALFLRYQNRRVERGVTPPPGG